MTKYLKDLQEKKVFTLADVEKLTNNKNTAKSILQSYKKMGYIKSVRQDLYVALDLALSTTIASRYEIAAGTSDTSYVSHHSALEYYGLANQVFFQVTISSKEHLRDFVYEGITYKCRQSNDFEGVTIPQTTSPIRVTDLERTVIDCIADIDLAGGLEEVLESIQLIPKLDEKKLLDYMKRYNKKILWQYAGFILEQYKETINLSDKFFAECKKNMGVRKNYLGNGWKMKYYSEWKLYAPNNLLSILGEGIDVIV